MTNLDLPAAQELSTEEGRLQETRRAFDSVASGYDGPLGNNALIQEVREEMWSTLAAAVPAPSRLLDLGCGTGLDAEHFARLGHEVVAIDWSPEMVEHTRGRIARAGLNSKATAVAIGAHELDKLKSGAFDAVYSNLGPLNCVPDLGAVSRSTSALLRENGLFVASVIERVCPWELFYFSIRAQWKRAAIRFSRGVVPVALNKLTVWTRYYAPREFYRNFAREFRLVRYRSLRLFQPPPYLAEFCERRPAFRRVLRMLDDRLGGAPLLRNAGDHFLIVMAKRDRPL